MIYCVNYENLDIFGKFFTSQFKLRYKCFIERQNYNVSTYRSMEYDEYDTPASVYLVYQSPDGEETWGTSRLTPVTQGSMIRNLWPDLIDNPEKIYTDRTWEGTRFCIDKSLPIEIRQKVCSELVLAYIEFGLQNNISNIIGIMAPAIFKIVFGNSGCKYDFLGKEKIINEKYKIRAASMQISNNILNTARAMTGIHYQVLKTNNSLSKNEVNPFYNTPPNTEYKAA